MKNHIIYHKDCMDGLASAFIAHCSFMELAQKAEFYPMHYNEINQVTNIPLEKDDVVMLLDFSLPKEMIEKIAKITKSEEKVAYLTFDDGPTTSVTPKILDMFQ